MPQASMRVINAQSVDLEIQQFLIQTGCDRDFAVKSITDWFSLLKRANAITHYNVNPVLNNSLQFSVSCAFPAISGSFNKIYSVASTSSLPPSPAKQPSIPVTPRPPTPPPYGPGANAKNPKKPEPKKKGFDADEAWKRAMRGI